MGGASMLGCDSNPEFRARSGAAQGGDGMGGALPGDGGIVVGDGDGDGDGEGNGDGDGTVFCVDVLCTAGQRCEVQADEGVCVDNSCADLDCGEGFHCASHAEGGNTCEADCNSDVACAPTEYCASSGRCEADVCEAGFLSCGNEGEVLGCASNGSAETLAFSCGSAATFSSVCVDQGGGNAGCSCEGDWDCPAYTECEVGICVGTGQEPTCTLDPEAFVDVPPALEIHWGGDDPASAAAVGSPWPQKAHVLNTPIVANLDDDNGDGLINELDFPEIIFVSHEGNNPWNNGVVRAIHGGGPDKGADYFARCGDELWKEGEDVGAVGTCSDAAADADSGSPVAVGDLDYDGIPEIVVITEDGFFRILDNAGEQIFKLGASFSDNSGPTAAIANLDHRGNAEIIIGGSVYVLDHDETTGDLFVSHRFQGTVGVRGDNENMGQMACPADIRADLPGDEIVVGTALYRLPDTIPACATPPCNDSLVTVWNGATLADPDLTGDDADGFCAVADVWGPDFESPPGPGNEPDQMPEVIVVGNGFLRIFDGQTGALIEERDLGETDVDEGRARGDRAGAPNVDDFDGDGYMEIATAHQWAYIVEDLQEPTNNDDFSTVGNCPAWPNTLTMATGDNADPSSYNPNLLSTGNVGDVAKPRTAGGVCSTDGDCNADSVCGSAGRCVCLHNGWRRRSDDDSSRATSSSVFDFNGDGSAEVVYNDECYLRVYDGLSGAVLYRETSRSRTGIEQPVVADVDNDGNAEIVVGSNTSVGNRCDEDGANPTGPNGLRVFGDPTDTWVSARRIWNQQSYHVTNVTEAGGIPVTAPDSWEVYAGRSYNTYRSQPRSFGVAPDLVVADVAISSPDAACGELSDNILIAFEIQNQGDLRVGPGIVVRLEGDFGSGREQLLDGEGEPLAVTLTSSLEPGASVILSAAYDASQGVGMTLPTEVWVMVDSPADAVSGVERECIEDNNEAAELVASGAALPDLVLTLSTAAAACPNATVQRTIANLGTTPAENVRIIYYAGDPSQGGNVIFEETLSSLAAGASDASIITIDPFPSNRRLTIWGVADPGNTIEECNISNNADPAENQVGCSLGPR